MSLTSEMSRITTEFEAAHGARQAAIAKIRSGVKRENHRNKASRVRTMATHRAATKSSLRDIFGTAAFTRGAAKELIERFGNELEQCASELRSRLDSYVADLRKTVGKELAQLTVSRVKMARQEESARHAQLKDLRRRVEALLAAAGKLIEDFNKDRQRAGRIWGQHLRGASRPGRAAKRVAAEDTAKPR